MRDHFLNDAFYVDPPEQGNIRSRGRVTTRQWANAKSYFIIGWYVSCSKRQRTGFTTKETQDVASVINILCILGDWWLVSVKLLKTFRQLPGRSFMVSVIKLWADLGVHGGTIHKHIDISDSKRRPPILRVPIQTSSVYYSPQGRVA